MKTRHIYFAGLLLFVLGVSWRTLFQLFSLSLERNEYTYILLVVPVSLTLIFFERKNLPAELAYSPYAGGCLLGLSLVLKAGLKWAGQGLAADQWLTLRVLSLVLAVLGSMVLCYGLAVLRRMTFAVLFLLFLVPLPESYLLRVVDFLKEGSMEATHAAFRAVGIPALRDGFLLTLPGLTIEVAEECSGIRSTTMLFLSGMVLAHLFLRSPWRQAVVVLFLVPLSIAKNALRIFVLTTLAIYVDPEFLNGPLHQDGGVVFFVLSLLAVVLLIRSLQTEQDRPPKRPALATSVKT
ncbi:MAG: exosortase [Acidobacteria bacterium]|nr:exosortase [Acidobacteriota bacterium]